MTSTNPIDPLSERIAYLEDNRRYIQNALEMVLSLEDFYTEIGGDNYSLETLLPEAKRRIDAIFPFDVLAFYMVDEAERSFRPTYRYPERLAGEIQREVDFMIDEGYFAWAIRERRGVVISSKDHTRQYLLHVIANHNQVKGMFGGLLPAEQTTMPDTAMTLLSIILLHVANAAESMAYTRLLKNQSRILERQVAERTRALTQSQQQLKQAMDRANALAEASQAASRAKGDFLANMSHELRTPLNGILGMTEVALSTSLDDKQRRIVEIIGHESAALLGQINAVLDFSKIESGKLELEAITFNLRRLMEQVGEGFVFQAFHKGVALNVFIDPTVPTELTGDPMRLRQILINLAGNAVKFTHEGEILIEAQLEGKNDQRAVIRFAITDTGIGIEPENLNRVFSSFTQAYNSTTRQYGGTGLGTTISKQLVELMGGQIGVDSRPGIGSTFWFSVGFVLPAGHQPQPAEDNIIRGGPTTLVVDHRATGRRILSAYLGQLGVAVITASNGETALALLAERIDQTPPIDVIIIDAEMPAIQGVALKDHIRRIPCYAKTPTLIASDLNALVAGSDIVGLGFDGCLSKPIKLGELKAALNGALGVTRTEASHPQSQPGHVETDPEQAGKCTRNGRILVVDDYLTNQQVAFMHLTAAGFSVDLAQDGRQAVAACRHSRYDLIFMDLQMPVLNGFEATGKIRALEAVHGRQRRTPIIALTANALTGDEQKCLEAGMDGFLIKPVRRHQLLEAADHWVGLAGSPQNERPSAAQAVKPDAVEAPVMDIVTAVEEFGDADTLKNVAGQFIQNVAGQLQMIRACMAEGDRDRIRKEAHAIKGGAATLEAAALSKAAARLEAVSSEGAMQDLDAGFGDLENQFYRFREVVSQWKGG